MTSSPAATPARAARPWRRLLLRLATAAVATTLTLLVAEVAVRIVAPQALSGKWRDWGPGYPVHRARTSARHEFADRVVTYRFDSLGLRGPDPDPAAFRVLCLGDSFTFGWLLDEKDTFVGRLQAASDARFGAGRVQFLNAGVGGGNAAYSLAILEDKGPAVAPDAVLSFLNCWDVGRARNTGLYVPSAADPTGLERRQPEVRVSKLSRMLTFVPCYEWLLEHSHLVQFARTAAVKAGEPPPPNPAGLAAKPSEGHATSRAAREAERDRVAVELGRAIYRRMKGWCDARRAPLWVVTTGRPYKTPADGSRTPWGDLEPTLAFARGAADFFAGIGVPFADTTSAVSADCGGDFCRFEISGDGHPDERGAECIARHAWESVSPWLAQALASKK